MAAALNLDDVTLQRLSASYDDLVAKTQHSYSADEWVVLCKEQIIRETVQHSDNPIRMAELLHAIEKLKALSYDIKASRVNGGKFLKRVCCSHLLERRCLGKPSFDKFASGSLWIHYNIKDKKAMREHVNDWWKSYLRNSGSFPGNIPSIFVLDGFTQEHSPQPQTWVGSAMSDGIAHFSNFSWLVWEAALSQW